jgi:cytochrome c oxidase accessory protein FixG
MSTAAVGLFEAQQKVYPREVAGRFARLRTLAACMLLGIFYGLPWLQWNDRQAVLFDLPARHFHLFGLTLWPQDFIFLAWLLVIAALSLFFFTALAGRVWCGYACPQTVWTEAFLGLERIVEGDRARRIKLDQRPWTSEWLTRKALKQLLWISFAFLTGFSFVAYFSPSRELLAAVLGARLGGWEAFWIGFYGLATYANAGYLREQVCRYMCPYARFQGAMFDRDTLIVSYDPTRGEPRGARPRGVGGRDRGLGDCIDCTICVQVCPTGIDIRKGLQYECIACAACIDACDGVMERMGYAPGLIRYATERSLAGGPRRIVRTRVVIYATLLVALGAGLIVAVAQRRPIGLDVLRDRNALFRVLADGSVENVYSLRLLNKDQQERRYRIDVQPSDRLRVDTEQGVLVPAGSVRVVAARLRIDGKDLARAPQTVTFTVRALDSAGLVAATHTRFYTPAVP